MKLGFVGTGTIAASIVRALGTDFGMVETYPKASAAFAMIALPAGAEPGPAQADMKKILVDYATNGVPPELVEASKKGEVASAEFGRNSISNLASLWSQALASEGRESRLASALKAKLCRRNPRRVSGPVMQPL